MNNSVGSDREIDEKKRKRLEKNRESARECRKRKKDKIDTLRLQLTRLEAENIQLRLKLNSNNEFPDDGMGKAVTPAASKDEIPFQLESMLVSGSSDVDIRSTVQQLQERYADYGLNRRTTLSFHLAQLRRCLLPTQTTRCILWLMGCSHFFHNSDGTDVEFVSESTPEMQLTKQLFSSLMEETCPALDQRRTMWSFTADGVGPFPKLQALSQECTNILDRLEELIGSKNESLDTEMTMMQQMLDARQVAKFVVWIHRDPAGKAFVQMLDSIWPHLTSRSSRQEVSEDPVSRDQLSTKTEASSDNTTSVS